MNGFHRKLRQFRKDWVGKSRPSAPMALEAVPRPPPRRSRGFLFNADDTPRGLRLDGAWALHAAAAPTALRPGFPRFRDPANDGEQRAA